MAENNLDELFRLKDIVSDLRTKVEGGGTRQQRQAWLAEQQEALKSIRAIVAQNKARRAGGIAPLQTQRNESAKRLNQSVQKRLSNQRQYSSLARLARNDLRTVYSMSQEHVLSFQPPRPHQTQEQVRTQQDTAQRARAQQVAVQRNHELFEAARMLVDPDELDDLMTRAFDAEVDVEAAEYGASQMRDMLLTEPARDQEGAVVTQAGGPPGLPSPAEVRQSVADWHEAETRSNANMRSVVRSTLDLAGYEALMAPEIPLPTRQREAEVRAQQDTAAERRLAADQEADYQELGRWEQEIQQADGEDPAQLHLLRTLAINRMRVGRRLAARAQIQQLYEAERAREALILHPEVIGDGQMLWDAEGDLEFMFGGLPTRRPTPPPGTQDDVRAQQDVDLPGLPGAPGYMPEGMTSYTVKSGDTLSAIAAKHDTTVDALAAANNIADPDVIQAGQELRVPDSGLALPRWLTRAAETVFVQWPERVRTVLQEDVVRPVATKLSEVWASALYQARLDPRWRRRQAQPELGRIPTPGDRNNNPGNIKHNRARPRQWAGMSPQQTDDTFVQFTHPEYGIQAAAELVDTHNRRGAETIRDLIEIWAPASDDNDVEAYARVLRSAIGGRELDARDPELMFDLLKAMFRHEVGYDSVTDEQILMGMAMARDGTQFPGIMDNPPHDLGVAPELSATEAIPEPGADTRNGGSANMVRPRDATEREVAERYADVRQETVHLTRSVEMGLGIKEYPLGADISTMAAADVAWRAWEVASLARQEGRDDQQASRLENLAWRMWRLDREWWSVTGGAASFRGEGAPRRSI